jgi:tetratricopeptide (TPR) repeat protein
MLVLAAAGVAINARHQDQEWIGAAWRGGGPLPNLAIMAGVHLRYLGRLLFPVGLSPEYALDEAHPWAAANLLGLAVLAAALAGSFLLLRRGRTAAGLASLWWFVLLLPASNLLVPITNAQADRYLHLPTLGACALAGLGFEALLRSAGPLPRAARATLASAALLLAVASAAQARVWRDSLSLWERAVAVAPRSGRAWQNRAEALAFSGRRDEAVSAIRTMLEVEPANLVFALYGGQRLYELVGAAAAAEAEGILRDAAARAPSDIGSAHVALSWLVPERGNAAEAVELLQEAVRRQPRLAPARFNLGLWHAREGRLARAAEEMEEALRIRLPLDEEIRAHQHLYEIYSALGDSGRARDHRLAREEKKALLEGF